MVAGNSPSCFNEQGLSAAFTEATHKIDTTNKAARQRMNFPFIPDRILLNEFSLIVCFTSLL
jgi:hypothetical protein